jgi:hypothetical protein
MSFFGYGAQAHSCLDGQAGDFICCEKIHHLLEAYAFNAVINFGFWSLSDWKWQIKDPRTSCHHSALYVVEMKSATL